MVGQDKEIIKLENLEEYKNGLVIRTGIKQFI